MKRKPNKNKVSLYYTFPNGDQEYRDERGLRHLIRNGQVIASGKSVWSHDNMDYSYKDENGITHLIKKGSIHGR